MQTQLVGAKASRAAGPPQSKTPPSRTQRPRAPKQTEPYHPPGEPVKVLFYSYAQDDEPLADIDLEPAEYARLKRAARKARCSVAEFVKLGIVRQLPQLEAAIAGGAR